jgi:chorismate mutase
MTCRLTDLREDIKHIDDQFMELLAQRIRKARAIKKEKLDSGEDIYQPQRQQENRIRFAQFSRKNDLDERHFNALYNLLHSIAVEEQLKDL